MLFRLFTRKSKDIPAPPVPPDPWEERNRRRKADRIEMKRALAEQRERDEDGGDPWSSDTGRRMMGAMYAVNPALAAEVQRGRDRKALSRTESDFLCFVCGERHTL